jgi:hypothetical protein
MIVRDYHVILCICGFPFVEIGIVSVGIRAILDPRMRPVGMDVSIISGTYHYRLYCRPCILLLHGLPLFYTISPYFGLLTPSLQLICRWHLLLSFPSMV